MAMKRNDYATTSDGGDELNQGKENEVAGGPVTLHDNVLDASGHDSTNPIPGSHIEKEEQDRNCFIYFDFETTGFGPNCDILQVAMRGIHRTLNMYVNPSQLIPSQASAVHGIMKQGEDIFVHGKKVPAYTEKTVVEKILEFLSSFGRKCLLIAHKCDFHAPLLIKLFNQMSLLDVLKSKVVGFVDTLPIFRQHYSSRKGRGAHTLSGLAKDILKVPTDKAHDANYDVYLLERLVLHSKITYDKMMENCMSFLHFHEKEIQSNLRRINLKRLAFIFDGKLSKPMMMRLSDAGITVNRLLDTYFKKGHDATVDLLEQKVDGRPQVIKTQKVLDTILDVLKDQKKMIQNT